MIKLKNEKNKKTKSNRKCITDHTKIMDTQFLGGLVIQQVLLFCFVVYYGKYHYNNIEIEDENEDENKYENRTVPMEIL